MSSEITAVPYNVARRNAFTSTGSSQARKAPLMAGRCIPVQFCG
nr:MAG TPA: hypothetical protein [Caudoviricetes sp.]